MTGPGRALEAGVEPLGAGRRYIAERPILAENRGERALGGAGVAVGPWGRRAFGRA